MIKQFKNLYETDNDRNPFKDFPHLQARLFYKELGTDLIVEGDMIQGHIATLKYGSKNSATVQDSICAVAINFNVSHEIILRNQKRHVTNLTFIIYRWRCNQISLWNILNQNYISSLSFTVLIPRLCILY